MRCSSCLMLGLLVVAGSARSQVRVRAGVGIHLRLPGIHVRAVVRSPVHRLRRGRRVIRYHHHGRGHWETARYRVWYPPIREWRRDACGRYYRVRVREGYYKTVSRRVWVSY